MNPFEQLRASAFKAIEEGRNSCWSAFGESLLFVARDEDEMLYVAAGLNLPDGAYAEIQDGVYGELQALSFYPITWREEEIVIAAFKEPKKD